MTPAAPKAHLTAPIWNWGVYYTTAVEQAINGEWKQMCIRDSNGIKRTAAESRRRFCINAYIYSLLYKPRSAAPLRFCKGNQKERTVSMEKLTFTPVRTPETIAQVAALAEEIWTCLLYTSRCV